MRKDRKMKTPLDNTAITVSNQIVILAKFRYWSDADMFCRAYTMSNLGACIYATDGALKVTWERGKEIELSR